MRIAKEADASNVQLERGEEHETAKLWADRSGNAVIAKLVQLDGKWYVDIRRHFAMCDVIDADAKAGLAFRSEPRPLASNALAAVIVADESRV